MAPFLCLTANSAQRGRELVWARRLPLDRIEPRINTIESLINAIEPLIDAIEPPIDAVQPLIDTIEPPYQIRIPLGNQADVAAQGLGHHVEVPMNLDRELPHGSFELVAREQRWQNLLNPIDPMIEVHQFCSISAWFTWPSSRCQSRGSKKRSWGHVCSRRRCHRRSEKASEVELLLHFAASDVWKSVKVR